MSVLNNILSPTIYGAEVAQHTGYAIDAAYAAGIATWIKSITGSYPQLVNNQNKTVTLILDKSQNAKMTTFFENSFLKSVKKSDNASRVHLELGPSLKPVLIKYLVPTSIAIFVAGYLTHNFLN